MSNFEGNIPIPQVTCADKEKIPSKGSSGVPVCLKDGVIVYY